MSSPQMMRMLGCLVAMDLPPAEWSAAWLRGSVLEIQTWIRSSWNRGGLRTRPGGRGVGGCGLQLVGHLVDRAGKCERQRVGEVHGRAAVHADVEALADRELDRDGALEATLGEFRAVRRDRQ